MTRSPAKKSFFSQSVDLMNGPIFQSLVIFMLPILVSSLLQHRGHHDRGQCAG